LCCLLACAIRLSQAFTQKMRVLAIAAQRSALQSGQTELPFGDAFKVADLVGKLSTRSLRRTMATAIARSGDPNSVALGMKQGRWTSMATFMKYVEDVEPFAQDSPNISDIVLQRRPAATMAITATPVQPAANRVMVRVTARFGVC
jgi:hypothetical protein